MSYQPPIPQEYAPRPALAYATPNRYDDDQMPADPGNPWVAIWLHPKLVMRWVLANDATRWVQGLILGGSALGAIGGANENAETFEQFAIALLVSLVLVTGIAYLISYFVMPWALEGVGRWLGGTGDRVRLRAAIAYAQIPGIWGLAVALPLVAIQAVQAAQGPPAPGAPPNMLIAFALMVLNAAQAVIGIWSFVIMLACIAVAHRFSMWKAFGTLMLISLIGMGIGLAIATPFILLMMRH